MAFGSTNMMVDDSGTTKGGSLRRQLTKRTTILFGIGILIIIIIIGVMVGILSKNNERDKCDNRISSAKKQWESEEAKKKEGEGSTTAGTAAVSTPSARTTSSPARTTKARNIWDNVRLPNNIHPIHYDMFISMRLNNFSFTGNSTIEIKVTEATKYILFHINGIKIKQSAVSSKASGKTYQIAKESEEKTNEFYVIEMAQDLQKGVYFLKLDFIGAVVTGELNGFYNGTYTSASGTKRIFGATDFQPTDARKAFPCFDEPAMKATFTISIEHDNEYHALSNMPAVSTTPLANDRTLTQFARSVRMPTYLVGYVISDFKNLTGSTGTYGNISIRTWATPTQYKDSSYGLKIGINVTTFLEKYYDVPFPLPKQDMIALPDFNSGAMENWGIIMYRETALLYKDGVSSESNKQRIANVVAHELAHMWFGNIVSCKWWNDIWLNEGFASYVEYLATADAEPDWEFLDQFLINDLQRAFRLDALATSHPITVDVEHPDQIKTLFDGITYSKGSSIIRMLSDILGENVFRQGLTAYLKKHKFGVAETKDLWASLTDAAGFDVGAIMETWTDQMGYPVVNITRSSSGKGKATQQHFLIDPKAVVTEKSPFNYKWFIQVSYIVGNQSRTNASKMWLKTSSKTFDWPDNEVIKCNVGQYGYYRVNYDEDNWQNLTKILKDDHLAFSSADRTSLIDDAFNLARAGQLDYGIPFTIAEYVKNETRFVPWRTYISNLGYLNTMLSEQESYGLFRTYVLESIDEKIKKVGWTKVGSDKHLDIYMRSVVLSRACSYGHEESNKKVKELFLGYLNKNEALDADLKSTIYYYGIANTGYKEWQKLFAKYLNTTVASERSKLLYGLCGSRQPWILKRLLRYSLDSTKIRSQDTVTVVSYVSSNAIGREFAWKFLKENWDEFMSRYSKSSFRMASVIKSTTSTMSSKIDLKDVKDFFKDRSAGSGDRAVQQTIEAIQANIDWLERSAPAINTYLEKRYN